MPKSGDGDERWKIWKMRQSSKNIAHQDVKKSPTVRKSPMNKSSFTYVEQETVNPVPEPKKRT